MIKPSRSLPSTARTWDVRFDGFHNRVSSCVPVTEELITRTVRAPLDLLSAACFSTATKLKMENFSSKLARCPLQVSPWHIRREARRHAPDPKSRRLVRSAAAAWNADSRNGPAHGSARDRKLVLCFRQRCAHVFPAAARDRHITGSDLRAFCR